MRSIVWWIVGLALTGCVHFHDKPLMIEAVGKAFDGRTLTDAGLKSFLSENLIVSDWPLRSWDFESLTFAAYYYHPKLELARASWAVSKSGTLIAKERPNPILSFSTDFNSTTSIPSPWVLSPSISFLIETANKRKIQINQATYQSEVAHLEIAMVAWEIRSVLRDALIDLDAAREIESLLREKHSIQSDTLKLLEYRFTLGEIAGLEISQARLALDAVILELNEAERKSRESRVRLAQSIGVPSSALKEMLLSFDSVKSLSPGVMSKDLRDQALWNRADILKALADFAASQAQFQLEIAKQYPDIQQGPGYQYDQGENKWTLGVSLQLPIFNRNQGAISEAWARREESFARFNALQASVLSDIELSRIRYSGEVQKQATLESLEKQLNKQKRITRIQFEQGAIPKTEWFANELLAINGSLAKRTALTQALHAKGKMEDLLQSSMDILPIVDRSELHRRTGETSMSDFATP